MKEPFDNSHQRDWAVNSRNAESSPPLHADGFEIGSYLANRDDSQRRAFGRTSLAMS